MNSPTVSVVMSVFNGQIFLAEAVESILNQTFRDFELLVIDDGSTDGTFEILAKYARNDERVRVHSHENKGRAASLNLGIGFAKGSYIARMDADDIALPDRLKDQMQFMERHPEVGLLGGAYERITREGLALNTVWPPLEDSEIRRRLLSDNPMCHPAILMRKDVAVASGGYRKALLDADDYDLWLRIAERCQLANLNQVVLRYRIHGKQVSIANSIHQSLCVLAARAAAALRTRGEPDPLSNVEEITPRLLGTLGVTQAETKETLLGVYNYWIETLGESDPEATLRVIAGFLRVAEPECVGRAVLANAWLKAAGIHYKQGRLKEALFSAMRAFWSRPIVMGRPVKKAFLRLAGALKS